MTTTASDLTDQARQVLLQNDRGSYTIPTAGLYPYQWNWDSAFAALGFAQFDIDRAWVELETLFSGQWADGMMPHILFHVPNTTYFPGPERWGGIGPISSSGITQPPVAATMAHLIYQKDPGAGRARIVKLLPKLRAWHDWFMRWRLDEYGAVCVTHPWESGRDNVPEWSGALSRMKIDHIEPYERQDIKFVDPSMRPTKFDYDCYVWLMQQGRDLGWDQSSLLDKNPFRVADPGMSFILLRAGRDLLRLYQELAIDPAGLEEDILLLEQGARSLWNPDIESYDAKDVHANEWAGCISSASFMCWYAGLDDNRQTKQLERILSHVKYAVPSHDPQSPYFDRQRYWRGPVWPVINMLIGRGLEECAHPLAGRVREDTHKLISKHGFVEYFDPIDGTPEGGSFFTWTAAVWLAWAEEGIAPI